jgi:allophanate hydrolase
MTERNHDMDRVEIAVVGAHMQGMALNGELVRLGARFARHVRTTSDYRLYALAGGPPQRPGLIRVPDGEGAAIEAEVWTLAPAEFGRFVADVPAPLSIGTVRLADGTRPKGFLVERQGLAGAKDITGLGSWRAFVASTTTPA